MTRIPTDPLASVFSGETVAATGDSREPVLDEESRFDAHLRRAEKKSSTSGEDRPPEEPETVEDANSPQNDQSLENQPEADSTDQGENNSRPTDDAESAESSKTDGRPVEESSADPIATLAVVSELPISIADTPVLVNVAGVENNLASPGVSTTAAETSFFTEGTGEAQTPSSASPVPPTPAASPTPPASPESAANAEGESAVGPSAAETLETAAQTAPEAEDAATKETQSAQTDATAAQAGVTVSDRAGQNQSAGEDGPAATDSVSEEVQTTTVPQADAGGTDLDSNSDAGTRPSGETVSSRDGKKTSAEGEESTNRLNPSAETTPEADTVARKSEQLPETSTESTNSGTAVSIVSEGASPEDRPIQAETGATESPQEGEIDAADRSRFVRRVAGAFEAASRRGGPIRVQLTPPELGTLRLEVKVERGEIVARVETDTQEARNVLLDNLPALRQRLEQQDIKVQRFDVEYDAGSDGSGPAPEDRQGNQEGERRNPAPRTPRAAETEEPIRARPAAEPASDGRLNLFA